MKPHIRKKCEIEVVKIEKVPWESE